MHSPEELDLVERSLRKQGHRWTSQRRRIAEVVYDTHEHFNPEELLAMCRGIDSRISRATVYRTIAVLEEAGFVEGLDTGDGSKRFEHVLGHAHHDHMICRTCGRIVEFVDERLERMKVAVAEQHGFRLISHELKLFVECQDPACAHRPRVTRPAEAQADV